MKTILLIMDGLGDRPIKELNGKTPLEAARTPNMDKIVSEGICGLMDTLGVGLRPGSDTAHLTIFGYPIEKYYPGRGPFEAAGVGMELKEGDVAFRANFGTVKNGVIIDRRAGRIQNTKELTKALNMKIRNVQIIIKSGTAHRAAVVLRGKNLSDKITNSDPHEPNLPPLKIKPIDKSKEAKFTADVLNEFLKKAEKILREHPLNKKRAEEGRLPANILLLRGAGQMRRIPKFNERYGMKAACVAGAGLYKGVAKLVGMEVLNVKGATGKKDTDIKAKFEAALKVSADFVFVHIKATDNFSHDGNYKGKKEFIEKVDKYVRMLNRRDILLIITGDHSTPCALKDHSGDPVPIVMEGIGVRTDDVKKFGERYCQKGGLHRIKGLSIMSEVMNLTGRAKLIGA